MTYNLDAANRLLAELALAGVSPEDEQRLSTLEERRITPDKELPPVEFLFRLHGKPCFARGELVGLSGKAKSGKTFVCSILMALCFRNEVLSYERIEPRKLHVLWYDTEQSDESTKDLLRQPVCQMTGIQQGDSPSCQFSIFNVLRDANACCSLTVPLQRLWSMELICRFEISYGEAPTAPTYYILSRRENYVWGLDFTYGRRGKR